MDRIQTMTTFVKVVQNGNFTSAGEDLGISRALASRHVADLESHVGVRLLNRTTRSVSTTEAGRKYFEACQNIIATIHEADEEAKSINADIEGSLSVLTPKWIGYLDVNAVIISFCKAYPRIRVHLSLGGVSSRTHEFLDKGHDVVFHTRNIRDSLVKVRKVAEIAFVLVASPAYLAARGCPQSPRDLKNHDCLVQASDPIWRIWGQGEETPFKPAPRLSANSFGTLWTAAESGLGIALLPRRVVADGLAAGRLVEVLPDYTLENRPLYAGFAPGAKIPRKVRALVDHAAEWFREHPLA